MSNVLDRLETGNGILGHLFQRLGGFVCLSLGQRLGRRFDLLDGFLGVLKGLFQLLLDLLAVLACLIIGSLLPFQRP